jgi:hypothetical protein
MNIMRASPAGNDAYYYGFNYKWDYLILNLSTGGAGVWTFAWEYWNGAWVALPDLTDNTLGYTAAAGTYKVTFTRPGDWALTNVNAAGNFYWIRSRIAAYASKTITPKGAQAWSVIIS